MKVLGAGMRSLSLAAIAVFAASAALAQDPVKVAPEIYRVTVDNESVRVLDVALKVGAKVPMHSHPGYVALALTPCKVRFTSADGTSHEVELKAGEPSWRAAESHSVENIGTSECHALNVEVKRPAK